MHWIKEKIDNLVTGEPTLISVILSLIILILTAFIGAYDSDMPVFLILLIVAFLLTLGHILAQIIEKKNKQIEDQSNQLTALYITKRPGETSVVNLSAKINKSILEDMNFSKIEIVLNTIQSPEAKIDLLISSSVQVDIKHKDQFIQATYFNDNYKYALNDVFVTVSPHNNIFETCIMIRIPLAYRDVMLPIGLTVGYDNKEHEYLISI